MPSGSSTEKTYIWGDSAYSREELVAEIGSAMICNRLGIENEKAFNNSAAYIQSWLKALKNDNKMIVWAAKKAEEAARYILGEKDLKTKVCHFLKNLTLFCIFAL